MSFRTSSGRPNSDVCGTGCPSGICSSAIPENAVCGRFAPRWGDSRASDWILLGDKRFQVDCHWPDAEQIVELDGWEAHRTRTAFREDRARDRRLRAAGYSVTHLTWNQLDDEPGEIAADLRAILDLTAKRG